jgi:hypothetical protein
LFVAQFLAWRDRASNEQLIAQELTTARAVASNVMWDLSVGVLLETAPPGAVQLGLLLENNGQQPIKWQLDRLDVRVEDHETVNDPSEIIEGVIQARTGMKARARWLHGLNVSVPLLQGTVDYSIRYGNANNAQPQYVRKHRFQVALYPEPAGSPWTLKTGDLVPVEVIEIQAP